MRRASAIRRGEEVMANLIGPRLRLARHLHTPPLTVDATASRAASASGYAITENMLNKIETQQRSVYDFEVYALALAIGVDARYLLGLTDDPGFHQPPELYNEENR